MSDQEGWDFCWSFSRVRLGLSDEQFFLLTPRQWDLLATRYREQMEHKELLAGLIAAMVANHSFSPPKKPVSPYDFFRRPKQKPREKRISRQAIAANIRNVLNARIAEQSQAVN